MIPVLLGPKTAFGLVDGVVPCRCLLPSSAGEIHLIFLVCLRTDGVESVLTAIFHSSSPREVLIFSGRNYPIM